MPKCEAFGFRDHALLATLLILLVAGCAGASPSPRKPDTSEMTKWKALVPAIQSILMHSPELNCPDNRTSINIVDAAKLTDGGIPVALIDYCSGGAYTDWIVAMRLEGSKPVLARFRNVGGRIEKVEFAQGASVMHSVDVKIVPAANAIYDLSRDIDGNLHPIHCGVRAYVWNPATKTFDRNSHLTMQATRSYCGTTK